MKKLLSFLTILTLSTGVQAGEVLYAEIDGTDMTLKCGDSAPEGTFKYEDGLTWNASFSKTITTATIDASCASYTGTTLAMLFYYCEKLKTITGLSNLNTANVTDMSGMFAYCFVLTSLDLSSWNTANVTITNSMFFLCKALTSLNLSTFNTTKVTNMSYMFFNCQTLPTIYGSNWDTCNVVEDTEMFRGCISLKGGAGTAYSENNANDHTFARIDGGQDAPGYFTDINTAGVKEVATAKKTELTPSYNLQGQRLESVPQKGIYIQNGKKYAVKK